MALLSKGVNIAITDADGNTVLHIACLNGESEENVLEILCCYFGTYEQNYGQDLNILLENRNNDGRGVIHIATMKNYVEVIRYLKDKGCNLNLKVRTEVASLLYSWLKS